VVAVSFEIDALVAHLYDLTEDEFSHVLSTFPPRGRVREVRNPEHLPGVAAFWKAAILKTAPSIS
jgi:hypothetical protein